MKLYSAPGFTSLADHIAMLEARIHFDLVKVDSRANRSKAAAVTRTSILRAMCLPLCSTTVSC